jgi:nicotinate phosphoribosyltransferase
VRSATVRAVPGALLTDLYELNMAASYLRRQMQATATFSLFVRRLPPGRAFLVSAGVEPCLAWLEGFSFEEDDLSYLAGLGFRDETLESFSRLRFTGDVWALPEGRIVFAGEPLLEVSAPIAEAQLAETYLLNQMTYQTSLATKAARCRLAGKERVRLVEFGFRRTQGIEAGIAVARLSAIVGFSATSNVEAARRYGLVPAGTMAHSYIEAFPTEIDAFRAFAKDIPDSATFLVDTYDTLGGVASAIEVIKELGLASRAGVRLDSGDLSALARSAREMLDRAGLPAVKIFVSGGLDERDLEALVDADVPFDAAGIGTRLGVSADAPYLDSAYKLVEYDGRPVLKLSVGKVTLPGAKQIFRFPGLRDVLGLRHESPPEGARPVLEQVMAGGQRLGHPDSVEDSSRRFESDLVELPENLKDLDASAPPAPELTPALRALNREATAAAKRATGS